MGFHPPPYPRPSAPSGPPSGQDWRYQRRILKDQARAQRDLIRAQRDAYRDQFRSMRRGSIVGPLLILAIGIVFLLIQIGRLQPQRVWSWYGHWWPLLLVGVGVVLLIEWSVDLNAQQSSNAPVVRHSIGAGVTLLLIALVLFGVASVGYHDQGRDFFSHGFAITPDNIDQFLGDKHESDQTVDRAFPANATLMVSNPHGDVTISGTSDDNQIHMTLHKQVFTRSDADADARSRDLDPQINYSGSTFNVTIPALQGSQVDLVITLPPVAPVNVTANHGDIHVTSIKAPVNITANHGDVEVSAITGAVTSRINNSSSSFAAHSVTGGLNLDGRGRDVTLSEINGAVTLNGDFFGSTHIEHVRGAVRFHSSRTDFQLARLDGQLEISSSDISAGEAQGPVNLTTRSRNVTLERISGDLSVSNSNGTIDLTSAPPLGNVVIQNRRGSVNLTVPEQASFTVQAETTDGNMENDFSLATEENQSHKKFAGTIGKGGSLIRINTTEGDIALKRANLAPLPPPEPPVPPMSIPGPEGSRVVITRDGHRIASGPDGSSVIVNKNGERIVKGPDSSSVYENKNGSRLTRGPDGSTIYVGEDGTRYTSTRDGTKIYAGSDGVRITSTPDGRSIAIGPGGKTLSDAEIREQLRRADDLMSKAAEAQRREQSSHK